MKTIATMLVAVSIVMLAGCSKDETVPEPQDQSPSPLKANQTIVFKGNSGGQVTLVSWTPPVPGVHKLFTGRGVFTHLGMCKMTFDYTYVSLNLNPAAAFNGIVLEGASGVITAANGDQIFYKVDVTATHPLLGNYGGTYKFGGWVPYSYQGIPGFQIPSTCEILSTTCTITGGTGKFRQATGTLTAWGEQWNLPLVYPASLQSYSVPIPTNLYCEGIINL